MSSSTLKREGLVYFYADNVFYNPAMATNRDVSIVALESFAQLRRDEVAVFNEKIKNAKAMLKNMSEEQKLQNPELVKQYLQQSEKRLDHFKGLKIFEGFASSGLRSIRYVQEIDPSLLNSVTANDVDPRAVDAMRNNINLNCPNNNNICTSLGDCVNILNTHAPMMVATTSHGFSEHNFTPFKTRTSNLEQQFNCVDLDPYGSASPYLRAAIMALEDEGLLCVTCTDLSTLCGNNMEACYRKYGSIPLHDAIGHEYALRIVLHAILQECLRCECGMEPMMSLYCDYYVRIFVKIRKSKLYCKNMCLCEGMCYYCFRCSTFETMPLAKYVLKKKRERRTKGKENEKEEDQSAEVASWKPNKCRPNLGTCQGCGLTNSMSGPIWIGPLHSHAFVLKCLAFIQNNGDWLPTRERLTQKLQAVVTESELDFNLYGGMDPQTGKMNGSCVLFYSPAYMSKIVSAHTLSKSIFSYALLNGNYQISSCHVSPQGVKTNAPISFIWDIIREWYKEHPIPKSAIVPVEEVGCGIINKKTQDSKEDDETNDIDTNVSKIENKEEQEGEQKEEEEEETKNRNKDTRVAIQKQVATHILKTSITHTINFRARKEIPKRTKLWKEAPRGWGPGSAKQMYAKRNWDEKIQFNKDQNRSIENAIKLEDTLAPHNIGANTTTDAPQTIALHHGRSARTHQERREPNKRICRFFAAGSCKKGDECGFKHIKIHPDKTNDSDTAIKNESNAADSVVKNEN